MVVQQSSKVNLCEDVTVDNQQRPITAIHSPHRARRAQRGILMNVFDLQTELMSITKMIGDNIGLIVRGQIDSLNSALLELLDRMLQQWSSTHRKHRFRS